MPAEYYILVLQVWEKSTSFIHRVGLNGVHEKSGKCISCYGVLPALYPVPHFPVRVLHFSFRNTPSTVAAKGTNVRAGRMVLPLPRFLGLAHSPKAHPSQPSPSLTKGLAQRQTFIQSPAMSFSHRHIAENSGNTANTFIGCSDLNVSPPKFSVET